MKTGNFSTIFYAAALAFLLNGCVKYPAFDISDTFYLNKSALDMYLGDTVRIVASPSKASYVWSSENSSVASVDQTGLVEALDYGFTSIIIKSGNIENRIDVHVKKYIPLLGITPSMDSVQLSPGNSFKLWAYPVPDDASEYSFVWSSEDPTVATVDQGGTIYGVAGGETNIVITSGEHQIKVPVVVVYAESILQKALGLWLFEDPDNLLKATKGRDLEALAINGQDVVYYPVSDPELKAVTVTKGSYFFAWHGLPPGASRHVYTLMFDFRIPKTGVWYSFYQTRDAAWADDAECFIQTNNTIGVGVLGYSAATVSEDIWYRLIVAVDLPVSYDLFLDGARIFNTPEVYISNISTSSRFALQTNYVSLLIDNDGDDGDIDVSAIAMWDHRLTDEEIAILGKANKYERE